MITYSIIFLLLGLVFLIIGGDLLVRGEIHNKITIDLKKQTLTTPENKIINYEVDPYLLGMLLKNQDFIDRSLSYEDSIDEFVRKDKKIRPWAYL